MPVAAGIGVEGDHRHLCGDHSRGIGEILFFRPARQPIRGTVGGSPMAEASNYNAAADLIERNLAAGRERQDCLHRRSRAIQLCRSRRAGAPVRQSDARLGLAPGAADLALPA